MFSNCTELKRHSKSTAIPIFRTTQIWDNNLTLWNAPKRHFWGIGGQWQNISYVKVGQAIPHGKGTHNISVKWVLNCCHPYVQRTQKCKHIGTFGTYWHGIHILHRRLYIFSSPRGLDCKACRGFPCNIINPYYYKTNVMPVCHSAFQCVCPSILLKRMNLLCWNVTRNLHC